MVKNNSKAEFVSIVGSSRSGTTLMRRILNKSTQIAISYENHFLGHIIKSEGAIFKFRKFGDLSKDQNVVNLTNYIYSGEFERDSKYRGISPHWKWIIQNVNKDAFVNRILNSDRSERALFIIIMQVYADFYGKSIIGEKTPIHIRYVSKLLNWFPNGKIIHMLRDPRAVYVSELRRRTNMPVSAPYKQLRHSSLVFKLFILLQTTFLWHESYKKSIKYKKKYKKNYLILRFEDLVKNPERSIRKVCEFIGIKFEENMMEQSVISKGFLKGQSGFDKKASNRWETQIEPSANKWFLLFFYRPLKKLGYLN
jgi:hypothetical protein